MLHSLNALVCATRQVVMIKTTGQFLEPIKVLSPPPRMVIVKLTPFAHKTPVRYSSNFTSIDFLLLVEMMVLSSSTGLKPLHSSIRIWFNFVNLTEIFFSICNSKIGFSGFLRNQQSSRENVVTRPIRHTAQPSTLSHEVSKGDIEENIW